MTGSKNIPKFEVSPWKRNHTLLYVSTRALATKAFSRHCKMQGESGGQNFGEVSKQVSRPSSWNCGIEICWMALHRGNPDDRPQGVADVNELREFLPSNLPTSQHFRDLVVDFSLEVVLHIQNWIGTA